MRWRWPPENSCGYFSPSAGGEPDLAQQLARRAPRIAAVPSQSPMRADRLGDDVAHAPARIEAGVGILEDHLHAPAQRRGLGRAAASRDVLAVEPMRPRVGA